ncbi:glycosyltransferase involved in cell wall biosynthesis [Bacillus ectoiniformans]|uniref:glycosyltransferase family 2 protein n=1 Tax=Bacillus ectoiniformans TaxID=1494429 RepID=UPI001EF900C0|nr:glycosyltransferase family 2 protein [Bacillus ectoiniformans]MBM7649328.1 glycosyltransferase involved in cell wall biosynthesis [Bacillus ectoiniformans]
MSALESMKVLIIVPAYNEADVIQKTIDKLVKLKNTVPSIDICIVNDGSMDETAEIIRMNREVILLDLPINLGIGGAVQSGYKYAEQNGYDIAVQFDADGQHSESDLLAVLEPIALNQCDMCIGSRFVQRTDYSGSLSRRIGIYYFQLLLFLLTKKKYTDATSGYRAINRNVIELFANDYPRDYPEPEVILYLHRKKLRIKEISVHMNQRQGGASSITPFRSIYYMMKVTLSILMQKLIKE